MLYPWQQQDWLRITQERSRLPNAWLLTGKVGIGKRAFASYLAQWLLCDRSTSATVPCHQCESCHWFLSSTHPDLRRLAPMIEEDDKEGKRVRKLPIITIEAVREVMEFVSLTSHRGGLRVILVESADALNMAAANALLKSLEEPPSGTVFVLVTAMAQRLLPTLRSRCRPFVLTAPDTQQALAWLKQRGIENPEAELAHHHGAPLFDYDPAQARLRHSFLKNLAHLSLGGYVVLSDELDKHRLSLAMPVKWLQQWLLDLAGLRLTGVLHYYPDYRTTLEPLSQRANMQQLMRCQDYLVALMPFTQHTLNVRLQLEAMLIEYLNVFSTAPVCVDFWSKQRSLC